MVDRIEKVSRVKGVDYDINRPYDSKDNGRNNSGDTFEQTLGKAMKRQSEAKPSGPSEAYILDLQGPTHSYFYMDSSLLARLKDIS